MSMFQFVYPSDLDMEGTITPDEDLSQEMGDATLEVSEDMRDAANEKRTEGSIALAEGAVNYPPPPPPHHYLKFLDLAIILLCTVHARYFLFNAH